MYLSRKFNFHSNLTKIPDTLYENQYTCIYPQFLLRMRDISYKGRTENQNTFCVQSFFFFTFENSVVREIMWIKYGRDRQATDDNITRRICFACWIIMATDTHSKYVILIAFPRNNSCTNAFQCYVIRARSIGKVKIQRS